MIMMPTRGATPTVVLVALLILLLIGTAVFSNGLSIPSLGDHHHHRVRDSYDDDHQPPLPTSCQYPCKLNHGCVCNHSMPHYSNTDGQWYGTCISCGPSWSGWDCQKIDMRCANDGLFNETTKKCQCREGFGGPSCEELRCIHHSTNTNSTLPNATNNKCTCAPGFIGLNCGLCTHGMKCPTTLKNLPNTPMCDTTPSIPPVAVTAPLLTAMKRFDCSVTSEALLQLIGEGRNISAKWSFEFRAPGSWRHGTNATASMGLWRIEPDNVYTDPFFFADLAGCSLSEETVKSGNEYDNKTNTTTTMVTYHCSRSLAECAPRPPVQSWWPHCAHSIFGNNIIPILLGKSHLACNMSSSSLAGGGDVGYDCVYKHDDLKFMPFPLKCRAASCPGS